MVTLTCRTNRKPEEIKLQMQRRINEIRAISNQRVEYAWNTMKLIIYESTQKVLKHYRNKTKILSMTREILTLLGIRREAEIKGNQQK